MAITTGPLEVIRTAVADAAEKVFSEPIHQDGLIVIPAASVGGGGGGGGGSGSAGPERTGSGNGEGGGFGLKARPAGALVIRNGKVRWQPAIDVDRVILGAQLVAATALLTARAIILSRSLVAAERLRALSSVAGRKPRHRLRARMTR